MTQPNQSELDHIMGQCKCEPFMSCWFWDTAKEMPGEDDCIATKFHTLQYDAVSAYITANYTPNSEAADKVKTAVVTRELELDHHWSKELERAVLRGKIEELRDIAPDMRTHPEYKGYVETSAGGRWKPLSKRIKSLEAELKKLEDK